MREAVIYCRFSPRPNAADCISNETQLDRCRRFCASRKWEIIGEHQDAAISGAETDRPGFAAALKQTCDNQAVLVCYSFSRIARKTKDACEVADKIKAAGAGLASVNEPTDILSSMGRAFYEVQAVFNSLEKAQISERTSNAMRYHQEKGRRISSQPPYGWEFDWDGPVVHRTNRRTKENQILPANLRMVQAEQDAITRIREMHANKSAVASIAAHLNDIKAPCRGKKWHWLTVKRIIDRDVVGGGGDGRALMIA